MRDVQYKEFTAKLIPTLDSDRIIGIRTPILRKLAKEISGSELAEQFLSELPHRYYEQNNLHAFLIERETDFDRALALTEHFLPYIDNWATCDSFSPIAFKNNTDRLYPVIVRWLGSGDTYTVRYAIGMLMKHYLDKDFKSEIPALIFKANRDEYYIKMMIAWYFATALAKRYDEFIGFFEKGLPDDWVHNKAIQKAVESYRITPVQKEYLKTLKKRKH